MRDRMSTLHGTGRGCCGRDAALARKALVADVADVRGPARGSYERTSGSGIGSVTEIPRPWMCEAERCHAHLVRRPAGTSAPPALSSIRLMRRNVARDPRAKPPRETVVSSSASLFALEDGLFLIWKLLARKNRRLPPQGPALCKQLSGAQARPSSASSGAGAAQASQCGASALRHHPP